MNFFLSDRIGFSSFRTALAAKDAEIERLKIPTPANDDVDIDLRGEFESLKAEQEDLLLMLSDQEATINDYKRRLALLGHQVDDEDED